ncbi:hypothetical protein [Alkalispirochaeta sphaeroplastigenens]|nr:hypothetical protein [Alkalispirochaeta sphaeroplastigenens]
MMISLYARNKDGAARYVTITDRQGNLFGYKTLTVTTGSDFLVTRERHFTYATEAEMQRALRGMIDRRLRKGYSVLYSFFAPGRYGALPELLAARQS